MKDYIRERVLEQANYITSNRSTIRATANHFNVSKSTTHFDLTERLSQVSPSLEQEVRKILDMNTEERARRGGLSTRKKHMEGHNRGVFG